MIPLLPGLQLLGAGMSLASNISGAIGRDQQLRVQIERLRQRQQFMREQYTRNVDQLNFDRSVQQSNIAQSSGSIGSAKASTGGLMAGVTAAQFGQEKTNMADVQYGLTKDNMTANFNQQLLESDQAISDTASAKDANFWGGIFGGVAGAVNLGASAYSLAETYKDSQFAQQNQEIAQMEADVSATTQGAVAYDPKSYKPFATQPGPTGDYTNGNYNLQSTNMDIAEGSANFQSQQAETIAISQAQELDAYQGNMENAQLEARTTENASQIQFSLDSTNYKNALKVADAITGGQSTMVFENGQSKVINLTTGEKIDTPVISTPAIVASKLNILPSDLSSKIVNQLTSKIGDGTIGGSGVNWSLVPSGLKAEAVYQYYEGQKLYESASKLDIKESDYANNTQRSIFPISSF